jgi:hypothetical protein
LAVFRIALVAVIDVIISITTPACSEDSKIEPSGVTDSDLWVVAVHKAMEQGKQDAAWAVVRRMQETSSALQRSAWPAPKRVRGTPPDLQAITGVPDPPPQPMLGGVSVPSTPQRMVESSERSSVSHQLADRGSLYDPDLVEVAKGIFGPYISSSNESERQRWLYEEQKARDQRRINNEINKSKPLIYPVNSR